MKSLLIICCLLLLTPALLLAQDQDQKSKGQGYVFAAPGAIVGEGESASTLHFGGGGEFDIYQGLGLGAEIGYLSPIRQMSDGIGVLSINGLYSFKGLANPKLVPFITGGYSLAFRSGTENAINFGGGVNYWFAEKVGLRFEFRDHLPTSNISYHILQGRVGVNFR